MSEDTTKHEFQAEVSQLLDIVINSLYTDREIFVRELVSNASDALEKMRHTSLTEKQVHQPDRELQIEITTDEEAGTITFQDAGIGMTREELEQNLGTIAHSGSKQFVKAMAEKDQKESGLIGQFGVGFYSAFMVGDKVEVFSRSWKPESENLVWTSDGKTGYTIDTVDQEVDRGSKIVVHIREDFKEYATTEKLKSILQNYSSFVSFPLLLGEDRINTVEALWRKRKKEITAEEYTEFYKFTSNAFDDPRFTMHFQASEPIELNALLFVPEQNTELFGFGQMESGVSLYCKNVLIDAKPEGLLPEWLRFLRGVIDSADIPLNISRESMQDSTLVRKIGQVITKRFIKFLDGEAKNETEKYNDFYAKFGRFLKEGVVIDHDNREKIAGLIRFESSMTEKGETTSFADYLTKAKEDQDKIYYLIGPDRATIESGPYLEAFKARGLEVIFLFDQVDEYLVQHLGEFDGKQLLAANSGGIDLDDDPAAEAEGDSLAEDDITALTEFLTEEFGDRVEKVTASKRLIGSPVAALTPENGMNAQMRGMMRAMNPEEAAPPVKVDFEINPRHELIKNLAAVRESDPETAKMVAAHLFDNALLDAGLLEDRKDLISRGFDLLGAVLKR